jgi:phosphatidylglycerol---prolipoprotein diacylglyceryl transferase
MHPVIFQFDGYHFFTSLFPEKITIYSYGTMIALGAFLGFLYTANVGKKKFNISFDTTNQLVLYIMIAAIAGGKFFMFFENPTLYIHHPVDLIVNFSQGFVFYGSLIFAIPTMLLFFRFHKIPILPMLDVMAITTCIVHGTGRIGCFFAGCCFGKPTQSIIGVTFTNPASQAEPLNTPLHPTQLYSSFFIYSLMTFLMIFSRHKKFDGQIILLYLLLYSAGRFIIEFFRGDVSRGYLFNGLLTNAQFLSVIIIIIALYFYIALSKKQVLTVKDS